MSRRHIDRWQEAPTDDFLEHPRDAVRDAGMDAVEAPPEESVAIFEDVAREASEAWDTVAEEARGPFEEAGAAGPPPPRITPPDPVCDVRTRR